MKTIDVLLEDRGLMIDELALRRIAAGARGSHRRWALDAQSARTGKVGSRAGRADFGSELGPHDEPAQRAIPSVWVEGEFQHRIVMRDIRPNRIEIRNSNFPCKGVYVSNRRGIVRGSKYQLRAARGTLTTGGAARESDLVAAVDA